jgi:uncharacterized protein YkwD
VGDFFGRLSNAEYLHTYLGPNILYAYSEAPRFFDAAQALE